MPDIFLSYSREDQPTARRFAEGLQGEGFTVWWDQTLSTGENYDQVTERALREAKAVVVLWSKASVESRWVRAEATQADRNGTLMPVMIEDCSRPIMFELKHTAELQQWKGNPEAPAWRGFVADLQRSITSRSADAPEAAQAVHIRQEKAGNVLRVLLPAVVVAGALIAGWVWFQHFRQAASAATTTRLAVLPFASLSTDPAYGFFADGLQDDLLTALAQQAPDVGLISRTTVMTYRDHPKTIKEIATELHVTHVLESSVRRDAEFVTLNVQLIDATRDQHLWSKRYDLTVADAQHLSGEVARDIAARLGGRVVRPQTTAPVTHDQQAYDLYLKARAEMGLRVSLPRDTEVIGWLDEAIARDPAFMDAYLQRARARLFVHVSGADRSPALVEAVRADIDMARKLAPEDPQVHWAESFYAFQVEGDARRSLKEIDEAMMSGIFDPAWERSRSAALVAVGRTAEALDICRRLVDLDPGNLNSLTQCARRSAQGRRPEEALRYYDMALQRDPDDAWVAIQRAAVVAGFTGRTDLLPKVMEGAAISSRSAEMLELDLLRREGHYKELLARSAAFMSPPSVPVLSRVTLHARRGEAALLLGDRNLAATEGRALLQILEKQESPPWERAYRLADQAIGQWLTGECDRAARTAREAQDLWPQGQYNTWAVAAEPAAVVAAWCGRKDEAVALLEDLARYNFGLPPADIALDPIYTVPLGDHKGFQALKARLEQQMRDTKLE